MVNPNEAPEWYLAVCAKCYPGVSLRDYFAGCAITGLLVDTSLSKVKVVTFAYEVADVMLEQREKPLNGGDNATAN